MSAILQSPVSEYHFRKMREDDLDEVIAIETSVSQFPWSRGIFHYCLNVGYFCWVMQHHEKVIAYSIMSVAADESHLLTIVVPKSEQGKGYGKKMLEEMIRLAKKNDANLIMV